MHQIVQIIVLITSQRHLRLCSTKENLHASIPSESTVLPHSPMKPLFQVAIVNILVYQQPAYNHTACNLAKYKQQIKKIRREKSSPLKLYSSKNKKAYLWTPSMQ